jgi:hypothetical protein
MIFTSVDRFKQIIEMDISYLRLLSYFSGEFIDKIPVYCLACCESNHPLVSFSQKGNLPLQSKSTDKNLAGL